MELPSILLPPLLPEPHLAYTADEQVRPVHSLTPGCCSESHDLVSHDSTQKNNSILFQLTVFITHSNTNAYYNSIRLFNLRTIVGSHYLTMNTHSGNAIDDYISIKSQLSNLGLQTWKLKIWCQQQQQKQNFKLWSTRYVVYVMQSEITSLYNVNLDLLTPCNLGSHSLFFFTYMYYILYKQQYYR